MAPSNKDRMPNAIIQASAFYDHHNFNRSESPEKLFGQGKNFAVSNSSSVSSPSSSNSNGLGYNSYNLSEEGNSVITFKPDYGDSVYAGGSLLSFEHVKRVDPDGYLGWGENLMPKCATVVASHGLRETSSSHHAAAVCSQPGGGVQLSWLNDHEEDAIDDQEMGRKETSNNKRPSTGDNRQGMKKQCLTEKKSKPKLAATPLKDPQSVAAKNRRERISERLKILQELVPNGSKVDLVTMLEKAIGYVKFLQLQVKVLATDEFWPAQGGKAPDLSQVQETIDAILASSQRDRNSNSKYN